MKYTDKAIQAFGFEDVRTITIAILEEQGKTEIAEKLFNTLTEEDEDNSPCPLCGEMVTPCDKEGDNYSYKCPRCGTQWREVR